ncbi:hypothetical protein Plhal304r1_c020g0071101 [Plasmopara halstedii]
MHRNQIRFHDQVSNHIDTRARITALLKLHLQAYQHELQAKSHRHFALVLRQLKQLIQDMGFDTSPATPND